MRYAPRKSPTLAAVLALCWPGAGHLYCGRVARGVLAMVLPSLLALASLSVALRAGEGGDVLPASVLAPLALWALATLWQIADARACASAVNRCGSRGRRLGR